MYSRKKKLDNIEVEVSGFDTTKLIMLTYRIKIDKIEYSENENFKLSQFKDFIQKKHFLDKHFDAKFEKYYNEFGNKEIIEEVIKDSSTNLDIVNEKDEITSQSHLTRFWNWLTMNNK